MVLRYWGGPAVHAEDFAHLVDEKLNGIRAAALAAAARDRGWRALPFRGERALVREQLALGRPVIALLEVRPRRRHYVVILAWGLNGVLLHDPATAPFRVMPEDDLLGAWRATERWALLVLPAGDPGGPASAEAASSGASVAETGGDPCGSLVRQAVAEAREGHLEQAEPRLAAAGLLCPGSAAPLRELAGIRFRQEQWSEAAVLAQRAARLDPHDEHVWRLLATSRFLNDDPHGALRAWNRVGEPHLDLVRIDGLSRIRYETVADRLDLAARSLLTPDALARARRRLAEIPAVTRFRLGYEPFPDGRAQVRAVLQERPLLPKSRVSLAQAALQALTERSVEVLIASPTGGGELWTGGWRFWANRPAAWVSLSTPSWFGLPVTLELDLLWEEQAFDAADARTAPAEPLEREERRRAAIAVSDWLTHGLKWELGGAVDEWDDRGTHASLLGAVEIRALGDRVALRAEAAGWLAPTGGDDFGSWSARTAWHVVRRKGRPILTARAGLHGTSDAAPLSLWPGAGTGHGRPFLLRAHPLLDDGVVSGAAFGRTLLQGTLETEPLAFEVGPAQVGIAGFADWARAGRGRDGATTRWLCDAGVGLRLRLPGKKGAFRVDAAHGLSDDEGLVVSAGWLAQWPE
jgi:hypothetical protein